MDRRPHRQHSASASAARTLLDKLIAGAPFEVRGIQVDGGSEFMSVFEDHCRDKGLELVVLPPKRPDLNGAVERAQSSWRYEFSASYELPPRIDKLQPLVDAFAHRYNHHRPHQALGDLTPAEYLRTLSNETLPSHMCSNPDRDLLGMGLRTRFAIGVEPMSEAASRD